MNAHKLAAFTQTFLIDSSCEGANRSRIR